MESHERTTTPEISQEQFLLRLRTALSEDGDFPTSAKIVGDLRLLASNPNTTANQIAEVILREPSLGARILHIVNSSFYHRSKPIMTISQAVLRIGMKPLAELCSGLILLQKFGSIARKGHAFGKCLTQTVVTSLISSSFTQKLSEAGGSSSQANESGYLCGSLSEMGSLLLAYYFPELYENAASRSELKRQPVATSIKELLGLTPIDLSVEVATALNLPQFYCDALKTLATGKPPEGVVENSPEYTRAAQTAAILNASQAISETVVSERSKVVLDQVLSSAQKSLGVTPEVLGGLVASLGDAFKNHCVALDIMLPSLPDYLQSYNADSLNASGRAATGGSDRCMQFIEEIREAVESREPSASVITTVLETLAFGLDFQRVLLMLTIPGKRGLRGRMLLGDLPGFDPKTFDRALGDVAGPFAPDARAYAEGRPVFSGDSVLPDGWPFVAIPVGFQQRTIGVIYADRCSDEARELSDQEQAAINILADLLDRSLVTNS